jgi:hypothetical protein
MSRYNFVSPGAAAGNAIEQFLVQRAIEERQRRMDELAAQNTRADNARADEQVQLQRENQQRMASAQDDAARLTKAQAAAGSLGIGGRIASEDPNAGLIAQYLPGVLDQDMTLASRHMTGAGIPGVMARTEDIAPQPTGMMVSRGTAQQKQAADAIAARDREQAAAQAARAAEGEASRQAAADRARDSNDTRMTIAGVAASGKAETQGLRNQLLQQQIDEKAAKDTAAADAKKAAETEAQTRTQGAYDIAGRLKSHPGLKSAYGAYEMRGWTQEAQDAKSLRDQLVASLALPNLGALKGPMSDKDILFIKQLATRLGNSKISDQEAVTAIDEAMQFLQGKGAVGAQPTGDAAHPPLQKFGATYHWDGSKYVRQ